VRSRKKEHRQQAADREADNGVTKLPGHGLTSGPVEIACSGFAEGDRAVPEGENEEGGAGKAEDAEDEALVALPPPPRDSPRICFRTVARRSWFGAAVIQCAGHG
jgi:hypothetical protein